MKSQVNIRNPATVIKSITDTDADGNTVPKPDLHTFVIQKGGDKEYSGTTYYSLQFTIEPTPSLFLLISDTPVRSGLANPSDATDPRNKINLKTPGAVDRNVSVNLSEAGNFGRVAMLLNPHWRYAVDQAIANNILIGERAIKDLVTTTYSREHKDPLKRGKPLDDPIINLTIDFDKFPSKCRYPSLRGKPRTEFFRYGDTTKYATVESDAGEQEQIVAANVYRFLTDGTVIRSGWVQIDTATRSNKNIFAPLRLIRVVVEEMHAIVSVEGEEPPAIVKETLGTPADAKNATDSDDIEGDEQDAVIIDAAIDLV